MSMVGILANVDEYMVVRYRGLFLSDKSRRIPQSYLPLTTPFHNAGRIFLEVPPERNGRLKRRPYRKQYSIVSCVIGLVFIPGPVLRTQTPPGSVPVGRFYLPRGAFTLSQSSPSNRKISIPTDGGFVCISLASSNKTATPLAPSLAPSKVAFGYFAGLCQHTGGRPNERAIRIRFGALGLMSPIIFRRSRVVHQVMLL